MGSDLIERPTKDDQQEYDDKFEGMRKSGAMGNDPEEKSFSPEQLQDQEKNPEAPEATDPGGESDSWYTGKGAEGLNKRNKKIALAIGGGVGAGLIGVIIGIMSFLQPYFMSQLTNYIESRVGDVPQYAVERRIEYYMNRYLMIRALGNNIDPSQDDRFTYLGPGFLRTMWTNWRGANIEADMISRGQRLVPINNNDAEVFRNGKLRADLWRLEDTTDALGGTRTYELDSIQARQWIRQDAKNSTSWHQLWKRHSIRKNMKRYLGVPRWKPFEKKYEDSRRNIRDKKANLRKATVDFKKENVARVTARLRDKTPAWLGCILENKCGNKHLNVANDNPSVPDLNDGTTNQGDEITDAFGAPDGDGDNSSIISKIFKKHVLARLLSLIASIFGALNFLDLLSSIVQSVNSGALNEVIYNKALQEYGASSANALSAEDQFQSGDDFDYTAPRAMSDTFKGFQESPVYQQTTAGGIRNADKSIRRDCNDDGDKSDAGDLLDPGEVVCPDKKPIQDVTKTITNNDAWDDIVRISDAYDDTIGRFVDWVSDITNALADLVGINAATDAILGALGLDRALASAFETLFNTIFGVVCTGAETGPEAFDCLYGGIQAASTATAGSVGDRTSLDSTLGGAVVSQLGVAQINNENLEQRNSELKNMNFFARYFSKDVPESLTSYAIINNPGNGVSALNRLAGMFNFGGLASFVSNIGSNRASAATVRNPIGFLDIGYEPSHPIFTANNGEGMDPDDLQRIYRCDLPVEERPQNLTMGRPTMANGQAVPFDVNTQPDPCMLEERVVELATMRFTGDYDDDIDGGSSSSGSGTGSAGVPSGDAQELARRILNDGNITFDSDSVRAPIQQIADGQLASVPSPEAPAPTTQIAIELLQLIVAMSEAGIPLRISSVTTGDHTSTSKHYVGKGLDIGNEDQAGRIMPFIFDNRAQFKVDESFFNGMLDKTLDGGQPYGRSVDGHDDHIHVSVF